MAAQALAIDYTHLANQAGGDQALMREVLRLFLEHGETVLAALAAARDTKSWFEHAHALKGSARGIGAFGVADAAAAAEKSPLDQNVIPALRDAFALAKTEIARFTV